MDKEQISSSEGSVNPIDESLRRSVVINGETSILEFTPYVNNRLERLATVRSVLGEENITIQELLQEYVERHGFSPDAAEKLVVSAPELKEFKKICLRCHRIYETTISADYLGGISHGICLEPIAQVSSE